MFNLAEQHADYIKVMDLLHTCPSDVDLQLMIDGVNETLFNKYSLSADADFKNFIDKLPFYNYHAIKVYHLLKHELFNDPYYEIGDDDLETMITDDDIAKFKIYAAQNSVDVYVLFSGFIRLKLMEAVCQMGAVHIFYFILQNFSLTPSSSWLASAIIGRNTDIINECLKMVPIDHNCIKACI